MSNQPIELILSRQFADCLNMAVFLVDPKGNLIFYNEAAESILGVRFGETGSMEVEEWSTVFKPTDRDGKPLASEFLPLVQTLNEHRPAHGSFYIDNKRGKRIMITVSAFPIEGKPSKYLGAMAIFWTSKE